MKINLEKPFLDTFYLSAKKLHNKRKSYIKKNYIFDF